MLSWIHQKGVVDFDNMTDFNKDLRKKLNSLSTIKPPEIYKEYISDEGTKKYLIKLDSGSIIEMVIIPEKNRRTLMRFISSRLCIEMYFLSLRVIMDSKKFNLIRNY